MSSVYVSELLEQPTAVLETLAQLAAAGNLRSMAQGLASGRFRRVVLTGMGSSYHALHPMGLRLLAHGIHANLMETSELIHYGQGLLAPESLVVAVSQSGASAEIVQLAEVCRRRVTLLAVTNSPESPLAQASSELVLTRAGLEVSAASKTYVAALAALSWLGDELLWERDAPCAPELDGAPQAMDGYLARWREHVAAIRRVLEGARMVYLVGRGPSLATVGTGGLTLKETARFPSEGLSCASFRHGPMEMLGPEVFVLVFGGLASTLALNQRLASDILTAGGRVALAGYAAAHEPFSIPSQPDAALPLLEILPVQMASLALAEMRGTEAGTFRVGSKVTTIE